MEIYLDNSATTRVSPGAANRALELMREEYGNPSSLHRRGFLAEQALASARRELAEVLGARGEELFFTSCGSEGNNLAILGGAMAARRRGSKVITTAIEHESVLAPVKHLAETGFETVLLPPTAEGIITPQAVEVIASTPEGQWFRCRGTGPFHIPLLGEYQLHNALTVLETVDVLQRRGWDIPLEAVQSGLERARWPGRLELVRRSPDVILDGGHNPQCMEALAQSLKELYPGKKLIFLTGVLADKNYPAMMGELLPLAGELYTITPDSPRALPAPELAAWLEDRGGMAVPCGSLREGLDRALAAAGPEDVVCACGSLYMIGEVRHLLGLC